MLGEIFNSLLKCYWEHLDHPMLEMFPCLVVNWILRFAYLEEMDVLPLEYTGGAMNDLVLGM